MRSEYENDIVFARFIRYMDKALLHRRINYLKHQDYILKKEKQLTHEEWVVVPDERLNTHSFCVFDRDELTNLIEKVTEKQKKVIYLSYFENKTNKKIADSMNITEKAVEALKTRALKKIREELERRKKNGNI